MDCSVFISAFAGRLNAHPLISFILKGENYLNLLVLYPNTASDQEWPRAKGGAQNSLGLQALDPSFVTFSRHRKLCWEESIQGINWGTDKTLTWKFLFSTKALLNSFTRAVSLCQVLGIVLIHLSVVVLEVWHLSFQEYSELRLITLHAVWIGTSVSVVTYRYAVYLLDRALLEGIDLNKRLIFFPSIANEGCYIF